MSEIVLAYSSIDKARAEAVAKVLGALGYSVAPQPVTPAQIDACKALIVFWSSGSVNSIPINQQAQQAALDKKLVSVRAGHADPPASFALVALHDLSRWTGSLEAPELRTFLQHVLRKAPPDKAPPQPNFAGALPHREPVAATPNAPFNFAGPAGASMRPEAQRAAQQAAQAMQPAPAPQPQPQPAPMAMQPEPPRAPPQAAPAPKPPRPEPTRQEMRERPSARRVAERRRAAGGGAARVAFGAIAVSVIAGAAVAAFNYEPQQTAAAPLPPEGARTTVAVTPNTFAPPVTSDVAVAPNTVEAGVQVASAAPLPAPLATPAEPATVQSGRGWTATLPTLPAPTSARAVPVSSGAPTQTGRPVALRGTATAPTLTAVDSALRPTPAPTDLVAIDNANLGGEEKANTLTRTRTPEEERAWARRNAEYGPER